MMIRKHQQQQQMTHFQPDFRRVRTWAEGIGDAGIPQAMSQVTRMTMTWQ